jgi:hypothetical protein
MAYEAVYVICPSETQKDNEEAVVLFKSFENQGFENLSMGALDCEVVHDKELISIYSLESQSGCPQTNFQKLMKPHQSCLMNKRITLVHIIWISYLKMFKNI